MLNWYRHRRVSGMVLIAVGTLLVGVSLSRAAAPPISTVSETRTLHFTHSQTRFITVHVKGRVISRVDHILVVYVPKTVFKTHTKPARRIVVPAHRVKIHEPGPVFGVTSAVVGVTPLPVTVTVDVPVTVTVPGPTTTVQGPTTTVTLPQDTTTVTVPTTITLPLSSG